ncbi:MAG: family 10 glycosylhydrolase [Candidatus Melainabacteria bacterium]|nr:family 10 glycosylhydrolase [Candidatus Melainabacteria bacterium]MBX9673479.1 family 10 glycosylhydrolase [Candidatus Obscuribacterales bacterium]
MKISSKATLIAALYAVLVLCSVSSALAASPVALLKSARNAQAYQDQHIGTFDDDYKVFRRALDGANVRYDELTDQDVDAGPSKLSAYKLIVVPLLIDLPQSEANNLAEFSRAGGKLVITDGAGALGAGGQILSQLAGVGSSKQVTLKEVNKLVWPRQPLPLTTDFAIASVTCQLSLNASGKPMANWQTVDGGELGCAVARNQNVIFMGWAPGLQGEISGNSLFLTQALDELSPGITQQAAVQISYADYQNISQELDYLAKRTDEAIKTARQAEFSVPLKTIQAHYDQGLAEVKSFNESYKDRRFLEADEHLQNARQEFAMGFAQAMPLRPVEARCVWLDRGTIVACRDAQGMAKLFDKLKQANINVVYFETNNAGFVMFPSKVAVQNPETTSWDPLGAAVEEAHKHGMEIHAWFWIFNVGNNKHNPIIGKEADYPGPVLSTHDFAWALASQSGAFVPPRQSEYWLDPSNPECRQYVKSLMMEVLEKYPVEGVQLDYIRYPFNNKGSEMGFNWLGRTKFERETGMSLDRLDDATREAWIHWKSLQVTSFVKEVSDMVRSRKPGVRISAAVYALPKRLRINAIQQEWETWVANGWVDTLNPMTYVATPKELADAGGYVRESTQDKALAYPGLSIRQLDQAGLIEQMDQARVVGTLGTTMFAAAHLDDKKNSVLKLGPYRKPCVMTPQAEPLKASRLLFDDFATMVNRYMQDPKKRIMSDTASTNDVVEQIDSVQKEIYALNAGSKAAEIDQVLKDVTALHNTIKEWLRLEAFIQRGFRAQYIANYLSQVEAILSYGSQRAKTQSELNGAVAQQ